MSFLIRLLATAVAVAAAVAIVPGIEVGGTVWLTVLLVALIFGFINATLGIFLKITTAPLAFLTLGLFSLVVNALLLMATGWFAGALGIEFSVAGFWPAFWGSIVISIVMMLLGIFLPKDA